MAFQLCFTQLSMDLSGIAGDGHALTVCFPPLSRDGLAISQDRNSRKATLMRAESLSVTVMLVLPLCPC